MSEHCSDNLSSWAWQKCIFSWIFFMMPIFTLLIVSSITGLYPLVQSMGQLEWSNLIWKQTPCFNILWVYFLLWHRKFKPFYCLDVFSPITLSLVSCSWCLWFIPLPRKSHLIFCGGLWLPSAYNLLNTREEISPLHPLGWEAGHIAFEVSF